MIRRTLKRLVMWCLADECPEVPADDRPYTERTWRHTRLIALFSFALSLLSGIVMLMFMVTIWVINNEYVAQHRQIKFDDGFDAIAAAASVGRLDLVAMILTFVGVVAAFSIIYGWTAFRSVAIDAAKAETKAHLPIELRSLMDRDGDRLVGLALQDAELLAKIQQGLTAVGLSDTESADQVDDNANWTEEGNGNGQGDRTAPQIPPTDPGKRGGPRRKSWLDRLFGREPE